MRAIVVGAGLGGLAAAVALRRAGHDVTVLEQADELRETGAGISVTPNGIIALDALGLGGPVRERAAPPGEEGTRDRHGRLLLAVERAELRRRTGAPMSIVPRQWLHELLAEAAGPVRTGVRVEHAGLDGSVPGFGTADVVVAADGVGSALRAALFPAHPGVVGTGEWAARGIVAAPPGVPLVAGELLDRRTGDRFGCQPMAADGVYWYSTWRAAAPADPAERHRWLRDRRADWHPCASALVAATPAQDVHVDEVVRLARPLPALVRGRVAFLGDAGHAMTPDLGQGANQAFEDAAVLGAVLATGGLAAYERHRRARVNGLQRRVRQFNRVLTATGPLALVRDLVLRAVPERRATRALADQCRFAVPS